MYESRYGSRDVEAVDLGKPLPNFLQSLFDQFTLLFVGCSLSIDRTMRLLDRVVRDRAAPPPALRDRQRPAASEGVRQRRRELLARNIRPIWYPMGRHECVEAVIRALLPAPLPWREKLTARRPQGT